MRCCFVKIFTAVLYGRCKLSTFIQMRGCPVCLLSCLFLLLLPRVAVHGQCGIIQTRMAITADSVNGTPAVVRFSTAGVLLSSGWKIRAARWRLDGSSWVSDSVFRLDQAVAAGLHYVEMLVAAEDSLTGDSCAGLSGHYYLTTASVLYASVETNGSGLTQTFTARLFGDGTAQQPFWNFGDGSTASGVQVTHTYAQPGIYTVYFAAGNGVAGNIARRIHAGTGHDNIILAPATIPSTACDSLHWLPVTQPVIDKIRWTDVLQGSLLSGSGLFESPLDGIWQQGPVAVTGRYRVPGQALLKIDLLDTAGGDYTTYVPVLIADSCVSATDTLRGFFWWDMDADGLRDPQEGKMDAPAAVVKTFEHIRPPEEKGGYALPLPPLNGSMQVVPLPAYVVTTPTPYRYTSGASSPYLRIGIAPSQTKVSGRLFLDLNADSVYTTAQDRPAKGFTVQLRNKMNGVSHCTVTDAQGNYETIVPEGIYLITLVSPLPAGAVLIPDTLQRYLLSTASVIPPLMISPQNFTKDLSALLLPREQPVPGTDFRLELLAANLGTDTCKGQFQISYDPALQFQSMSPPGGIHDPFNATVTWYSQTLFPVSDALYTVRFLLPASAVADSLINRAFLFANPGVNDIDLTNNVYACTTTVGNARPSFFKSVTPEGTGMPGLIQAQDRLHYRLSYRNTGAGTLHDLVLQDELSPALDPSSFQLHHSTHPVELITRQQTLTFRYAGIALTDTTLSADSSRLDLVFSVRPYAGTPGGTVIDNTAFAWTDAVTGQSSNTITQMIQTTTGIAAGAAKSWQVYPNPFTTAIYLIPPADGIRLLRLCLTDISGKTVIEASPGAAERSLMVSTATLLAGTYFLHFHTIHGESIVKMVKW